MAKNRIKKPESEKSKRISIPDVDNYDAKPPIFSLERLQNGAYCFSKLEKDDKSLFAEAIFNRRNLTWTQVRNIARHGLGSEKIAKKSIKTALPVFVKDDIESFLAFRFSGLKAMVGYRIRDIFYVLWFDHDFSLYDH